MPSCNSRSLLVAIPLTLGALAIAATGASANAYSWGTGGSGVCASVNGLTQSELGQYCMQSVTGWIQINRAASQQQVISCDNNAANTDPAYGTPAPSLGWSLDGQSYDAAGAPWPLQPASGSEGDLNQVGWNTGTGSASLSQEMWMGGSGTGYNGSISSTGAITYGSGGAGVTNWGGNGYWQAALACVNAAGLTWSKGGSFSAEHPMSVTLPANGPFQVHGKIIDVVDTVHHKASLTREYALKKNVTRTDTRTCPAGMVRKGKLAYTIQEFPSNHKSPKWKDRSLVSVTMTPKGKNAAMVSLTLTQAKNPTLVQFQMRCAKA